MTKRDAILALISASLTVIGEKYAMVLAALMVMGTLANLMGCAYAVICGEGIKARKVMQGMARLVFYLVFYIALLVALEQVASYLIPPLLSVAVIYEAGLALKKAVLLNIIPAGLVRQMTKILRRNGAPEKTS
jgi:hypothetical protein